MFSQPNQIYFDIQYTANCGVGYENQFSFGLYTSGSTLTAPINYPTGTYCLKARSRDSKGNASAWSNCHNVVISVTAPTTSGSIGTIGSQVLGTPFTITVNTTNVPTGSTITLAPSFGNIYPSSFTTSGNTNTVNVTITSTQSTNIVARYNGNVIATSNTFSLSPATTCLQEFSLEGVCTPPSPTTPDPKSLTPGTIQSPGPELQSISQTFTWNAVPGATRYAFYLRDLDTGDLTISTENVTTNSYTYNYLRSGGRFRWNVVAFDSTGKGGWSADPVYFTVKAGLSQPSRTIAQLTQDELSLCDGTFDCSGITWRVVAIDTPYGLQALTPGEEYFIEGLEDEVFISGGGYAIGKLGSSLVTSAANTTKVKAAAALALPYVETIAKKSGAKWLAVKTGLTASGIGTGFLVVGTVGIVAYDTSTLTINCASVNTNSTDALLSIQRPYQYFCGRLTLRAPIVAALTIPPAKPVAGAVASYLQAKGFAQGFKTLILQSEVDAIVASGLPITKSNVVLTFRNSTGNYIWLETGMTQAEAVAIGKTPTGLKHIVEKHGQDFVNNGIPIENIEFALKKALWENNIVGKTAQNQNIFQITVNGNRVNIAIGDSTNGYIITAFPPTGL